MSSSKGESRTYRVLNLGAGVGSTTVFLLARMGRIGKVGDGCGEGMCGV